MAKNIEPNLREQYQSLMETTPGMALLLALSFAIAMGRFIYVTAFLHSDSVLDAIGIFSPWFSPWVVVLVSGLIISVHSDEIEKKAKVKVKKRLSSQYSHRH